MDAMLLSLSNLNVDDLARQSFTMGNSEPITFEEAYSKNYLRKRALQFYRNTHTIQLPLEFTQFVLRNSAVNERGCHHFKDKLSFEVLEYLKGLIGRWDSDIQIRQVHRSSEQMPSGFLGVLVKYFFKKVVYNLRGEVGRYEYAENYATVFPFQVVKEVPIEYDIEVAQLFDDDFYKQMKTFLNHHFESVDAREVVPLFLANINHFKATRLPQETLIARVLRNRPDFAETETEDYLSSFPRLNENGVRWFKEFYNNYKHVRKILDKVDISLDMYDDNYFQSLPESNFIDLYELLNTQFYVLRRQQYIERVKKYLFFFVHALKKNTNPVFFIDDVLFECLKSLHRFKTSSRDVELTNELSMLSLVHLRTKCLPEYPNSSKSYHVDPEVLRSIKCYIEKIPNIHDAEIDLDYKTDYLHGWMLLRNNDTCYEMCYSRKERKRVDDFIDRIFCSVLPSDDKPIKYVVMYNSFKGQESKIMMPENIQAIRNFIRLTNTYDFDNYTLAESNDEFLTRDLKMYFNHLSNSD